jgi:hypothetical protein
MCVTAKLLIYFNLVPFVLRVFPSGAKFSYRYVLTQTERMLNFIAAASGLVPKTDGFITGTNF